MSNHSAIVDDFIKTWERKDLEGILTFFRDDAVYLNVPMEPANVGKAMIRTAIEGFVGMAQQIQFIVHKQTADEKAA